MQLERKSLFVQLSSALSSVTLTIILVILASSSGEMLVHFAVPSFSVFWVLRWSSQKPKYQYRDHLVGQLTREMLSRFLFPSSSTLSWFSSSSSSLSSSLMSSVSSPPWERCYHGFCSSQALSGCSPALPPPRKREQLLPIVHPPLHLPNHLDLERKNFKDLPIVNSPYQAWKT